MTFRHTIRTPWGSEPVARLRGTHRPETSPYQWTDTGAMRTKDSDGFSFYAGQRHDPVFVVRRVDRRTARIETFEGVAYSEAMPIADAIAMIADL